MQILQTASSSPTSSSSSCLAPSAISFVSDESDCDDSGAGTGINDNRNRGSELESTTLFL
jgi:hypothetical protein